MIAEVIFTGQKLRFLRITERLPCQKQTPSFMQRKLLNKIRNDYKNQYNIKKKLLRFHGKYHTILNYSERKPDLSSLTSSPLQMKRIGQLIMGGRNNNPEIMLPHFFLTTHTAIYFQHLQQSLAKKTCLQRK